MYLRLSLGIFAIILKIFSFKDIKYLPLIPFIFLSFVVTSSVYHQLLFLLGENFVRINEMALHEKPRERLITYGAKSLSNVELLAILLNTGRKGFSSIDIANELLKQQSTIRDLKNCL